MSDLENLKLDAEALGIKFRADIGASKLQAKIDDFNKKNNPSAVVEKTPEPAEFDLYRNTSDVNVFTEAGRCKPNGRVRLTKDEAKQYKDLELCAN